MKVNLNILVRVVLTDAGLNHLIGYYRHQPTDRPQPLEHAQVFLLWELMHIFGPMCYHGNPDVPFENNEITLSE